MVKRPDPDVLPLAPGGEASSARLSPDAASKNRGSGPGLLAAELRTPLAAVNRTLQRLSLQRIGASSLSTPAAAQLVRRARQLVAELTLVVDELLDLASPALGPVLRSNQATVRVRDVFDTLIADVGSYVRTDQLQVRVPDDLKVTTHAPRLGELLVNLVAAAARAAHGSPIVLEATPGRNAVRIDLRWDAEPSPDQDPHGEASGPSLARSLARSLGARIELTHEGRHETVRVVLPQQRTQDRTRRHDAVS